ncbi:unnamed protein product [Microthlaspi erraticum]|uniref:Uncharacterized protein n=1 Tax=Microthlaspi erraticum TaxID=1685480 RepID=A0A6D2K6Y3_9BRAS|nr:unnamed protein product [Microthlaspi erraticum]
MPKPPDLQLFLRPLVLYPSHSSHNSLVPYPGHLISVILPNLSFLSIISLSFGQWNLIVLLLAGEWTSGSWIPGFVNLHILVRRFKILGLTHEFFVGSSLAKLFLPRRLYKVVTLVSFKERFSSLSFLRKKRIMFFLVLSMRGKLYSVWKPRMLSSFIE